MNYINKLPQNINGLLKPANNFAIKAPRNTQWKDTKWKKLYENQAKLIDQENKMEMAGTAGQNCINNGHILRGLAAYAGKQFYESTGAGVQNRTKINETGSQVRKETTEYFKTQFGPVLEMKKDFKDLETDKKNQQETYKKLKTTAENDYHILPKKSIMNMTRILYQIWSTVADLIEKIKSNYGKRLDKGFFMSAKKKEEQLKSIEENITNCINLLNRDFESKVQEFEKRIENLKTEVTPISKLSDSASDEIETLTRFCDSVKEKVTKFVEVNKTLGTHIVEASEVVCYVNTGEQPMQGMLLNQKQFPESPDIELEKL